MKIAIDIDDVLADSVTTLIEFFNENFGPPICKEDLINFTYWGFLGNTREEANEKYFKFTESELFDQILPMEGSIEAIDELSEKNELYLITGRPCFVKEQTEQWINKYFPGKFKGIHFTNNRVSRDDVSAYWGRPKAEICDEIGAEILIDDLFEYIKGSEHLSVLLLDQVWNSGKTDPHICRVTNWREIVEIINKKAKI